MVETCDVGALINIGLTVDPLVARLALALMHVDTVETVGTILARLRRALIDVDLTVDPLVARLALALIHVDMVETVCAILARLRLALINV